MSGDIKILIKFTYEQFQYTTHTNDKFVDVTLSLLALKMLSDRIKQYYNLPVKWRSPGDEFTFDAVMSNPRHLGLKNKFQESTRIWERENPDYLKGVLEIDSARLKEISDERWEHICNQWYHFFKGRESTSKEELLEAFDYLENILANTAEFYTPTQVASLMVEVLKDGKAESIFDPFCRGGDMLTVAVKNSNNLKRIVGITPTGLFWKLAKIRMLAMNIQADISIIEGNALKISVDEKFDSILLNPPFGNRITPHEMPYSTGRWGQFTNRTNRTDLAYLGYALDHLKNTGEAAIIMPNIILSGQGIIKHIRSAIIAENLLEGVITLPPKIFYNTGVSAVILFLNKNRISDDVFLIDASGMVYKKGKQYYIEEGKVIDLLKQRHGIGSGRKEKHLQFVKNNEIIAHDYDLQFSSYAKSDDNFLKNLTSSKEIFAECSELEEKITEVRRRINLLIKNHYN